MDFGKLPNVDHVDFKLPPDPPENEFVLSGKKANNLKIFVGAPVWGDKSFVGTLYPNKTKSADYLKYYSKAFNAIEMSGTYYKIPTETDVLKWKEQVDPVFIFSPKISQVINHSLLQQRVLNLYDEFVNAAILFESNLGASFMLLPDFITTNRLSYLQNFIVRRDPILPLNIEIRHQSWFDDHVILHELFDLFLSKNIGTVISDVAGRRDASHMRLTTKTAFIRFAANNHTSDFTRIDDWVDRLYDWQNRGLEEFYFYIHVTPRQNTIALANYFIDQTNKRLKRNDKKITDFSASSELSLF